MPADNEYGILTILTVIAAWYGAIVASAVAYWNVKTQIATKRETQAMRILEARKSRMDTVFNRYIGELAKTNIPHGPARFMKAGAATLKTDVEIREVAGRIKAHGERDPLRRDTSPFNQNMDFKKLYDYFAEVRFDFSHGKLDEAIEKSGTLKE